MGIFLLGSSEFQLRTPHPIDWLRVDKKLTLSKLQAQMWQKNTEKDEDFTLSDLEIDDETIQNLIRNNTLSLSEAEQILSLLEEQNKSIKLIDNILS